MQTGPVKGGQFEVVAEAYDRNADEYDLFLENNPNLDRLRQIVYSYIREQVPAGGRILDLACGTGTDAIWSGRNGYSVVGVDISAKMLERARQKAFDLGMQDRLEFRNLSYTDLASLQPDRFDCVFSNFGGLNCVSDLRLVTAQVFPLLRPGAVVIWVVMPSFCLWESMMFFRGRFGLATRRFSGSSTVAKRGLTYPVYYYKAADIKQAWGKAFTLQDVRGLSVLTPPATNNDFAEKRPGLFAFLCKLDALLSPLWPFKYLGDFSLVTLRLASDG